MAVKSSTYLPAKVELRFLREETLFDEQNSNDF